LGQLVTLVPTTLSTNPAVMEPHVLRTGEGAVRAAQRAQSANNTEGSPLRRDIDRLARRYTGSAYPDGVSPRVSARMRYDGWHGWVEGKPWPRRS
jgi:hypothetical protein